MAPCDTTVLPQPLKLASIRTLGKGDFEVRYTFRAVQKAACNGRAVVTIVKDGDLNLIQGIRSLTGCSYVRRQWHKSQLLLSTPQCGRK